MPDVKVVHVAVGVIINQRNEVLISLRHPESHQGGLWEFPGGKLEPDEDVQQALGRELLEELNIRVQPDRQLLQINYDYPDKSVLLDVWLIRDFVGEPVGKEGQPIQWQAIARLDSQLFPPANASIIEAIQDI